IVREDEEKEVRTTITKDENGFNFAIVSRSEPGEHGEPAWQEHARGKIAHFDLKPAKHYELTDLEEECNQDALTLPEAEERFKDTGPLVFGPRWKHLLKRVTVGTNQALAVLELPAAFATDLESSRLHPALLDVATSFVVLEKEELYLPFSYKGLKVNGPLPEKVYSYIRWNENNPSLRQPQATHSGDVANRISSPSKKATLHLNITIMDEQGTALVEIQDYTLRRADDTTAL